MVDPREILKMKPLIKNNEKFLNNCRVHTKSFMNMYCMDCDEEPLCASCSSDEIESKHRTQGHKVLHVQKISHMNAIKEKDIEKHVQFDIFKLKNNGNDVFAIRTKGKPEAKVPPGDQNCVHCRFMFKTNEKSPPQPNAKYCSLQCKMEDVENSLAISPASSSVTAAASDCSKTSTTITGAFNNGTSPCHNPACHGGSYRKRPRKARHPCRAPFF